jgi:hypothetical protein
MTFGSKLAPIGMLNKRARKSPKINAMVVTVSGLTFFEAIAPTKSAYP